VRSPENSSLELLEPVPQELLDSWLAEFYGHSVNIAKREVLRHRDLSYVERLWIADSLPFSLIYKLVLPPWDIEKDILERVLIPSVSNSAQLYLAAHYGPITALFLEDLGTQSLVNVGNSKIASDLGKDLAKMHRAYVYRVDELMQSGVLRMITPIDYTSLAETLIKQLKNWHLLINKDEFALQKLASTLASQLAREPISLVHGDYYAENVILHNDRLSVIDWSWFTFIGVPLLDLATITSAHAKNGNFIRFKHEIIEAYCDESARETDEVIALLPYLQALSRLLFLQWLVVRKLKGIEGTTVGPVNDLILQVVQEVVSYNKAELL
jgi:hypothetical protein